MKTEARSARFMKFLGERGLSVGLIVMAASGLWSIDQRGFWLDETYTWGIIRQPSWSGFLDALDATAANNYLYLALLRVWSMAGEGEVWLRIPSLVFALLTVVWIHRIGLRVADRATAGVAAVLAGSSVPLLFYGLEARGYAMMACFTALAVLACMDALERDSMLAWCWVGLAAFAAVGAHIVAVFSLPVLALLVAQQRSVVATVIRMIPVGIGALPGLAGPVLAAPRDAGFPPPLELATVVRVVRFLAGDHGVLTRDGIGFALMGLYLVVLGVAFVLFVVRRPGRADRELSLWLWLIVPVVLMTASSVVEPVLWHRMVIGSLPAVLLVVAWFLSRRPSAATAVVVVLLFGLGLARSVIISGEDLWEYEDLAAELDQRAEIGDTLVFLQPWERAGLDYYYRDRADLLTATPPLGPRFEWGVVEDSARVIGSFDGPGRLWTIDGADAGTVWRDQTRTDDEFVFDDSAGLLDRLTLVEEFDLGRFRVRAYER